LTIPCQVFDTINVATHVRVAATVFEITIARFVPTIPFIPGNRRLIGNLRICRIAAHDQRESGAENVGLSSGKNLRLAGAYGHLGGIVPYRNAIHAVTARTNREVGRADLQS
jgi:Pyruvate/2-oxoacid:ferredoxin oxidoreductase gamma subunit